MNRQYYSIFNDALGPIMTGPSSSHSAGCCRIGLTVRSLFGKEIEKADVVFEEQGSYPSTYIGQGSSFGFAGGLLGFASDDPRLKDAVELAASWGREIRFMKEPLGFLHPNQAEIRVYDGGSEPVMRAMTFSIGGGMFEITRLDGFEVMIDGGADKLFIREAAGKKASTEELLNGMQLEYSCSEKEQEIMFTVILKKDTDVSKLEALAAEEGVVYVRRAVPVVPVIKRRNQDPPFFNAEEALRYAGEHGSSLWQLCEDYETGYGYVDREEIRGIVEKIYDAMDRSTHPVDPETTPVMGFLPYHARKMQAALGNTKIVGTGILEKAMMAAISVMENSCAHNIIVAAPTAGSSGVIPAAVVTVGKEMGCTKEEICRALMAAGLVGVFIANQATFGGEVGACQAENGSAAAMAAAGVVQLLGGSVRQGFEAAGMAMQNMLGLICDPVAGLTEIPCISRNVSSMANAVFSANMSMLGFDPMIPLDEVIRTMGEVGAQLPAELRCTCGGGLCTTPTGCRLQEQVDSTRPVL